MSTPASNSPGELAERAADLIEDLASGAFDGPVIVLVDHYRQRDALARELVDETEIHDIHAVVLRGPEESISRLPALSAATGAAAIVLLDRGTAEQIGPWLEASREALSQWVRFFIILMMPSDVPALATTAPGFMSLAKALEFSGLASRNAGTGFDIEQELARLTAETGLTPEQFIASWQAGRLPDTFRNTTWLNLAWAATRKDVP